MHYYTLILKILFRKKFRKKISNGTIVCFRVKLTSEIDMYKYLNQIEYKL